MNRINHASLLAPPLIVAALLPISAAAIDTPTVIEHRPPPRASTRLRPARVMTTPKIWWFTPHTNCSTRASLIMPISTIAFWHPTARPLVSRCR